MIVLRRSAFIGTGCTSLQRLSQSTRHHVASKDTATSKLVVLRQFRLAKFCGQITAIPAQSCPLRAEQFTN
jgi:hypothetical protein